MLPGLTQQRTAICEHNMLALERPLTFDTGKPSFIDWTASAVRIELNF